MHVIVTIINHQSIRYAGVVIRHGIDIKLNSIKRELPASNTTCVRYIALQSQCASWCVLYAVASNVLGNSLKLIKIIY